MTNVQRLEKLAKRHAGTEHVKISNFGKGKGFFCYLSLDGVNYYDGGYYPSLSIALEFLPAAAQAWRAAQTNKPLPTLPQDEDVVYE